MNRLFVLMTILLLATPTWAVHSWSQQARGNETWITIKVNPVATGSKLADVLFVIDDSGSMSTHQSNLSINLPLIAQSLAGYSALNAAVLTTSTSQWAGTKYIAGHFINGVHKSSDPDFLNKLNNTLKVGTNGDANEMPFESMGFAFSEPLISTVNKDFLRPNADLYIYLLTDAEDQSYEYNADKIYQLLKSHKPTQFITTIAGLALDVNCLQNQGVSPTKILDFVNLTGGAAYSLCGDFSANMVNAIQSSVTFNNEISLPNIVGKSVMFSTLKVTLAGQALPAGDIVNGWIYDPASNKIIIGTQAIKSALTQGLIEVTYQVQ